MSIHELQARFQRLHKEHAAWRLLRTDNAALILAFVGDLFAEVNEVAFGRAKVALDTELDLWREEGRIVSDVNAASYLRQWIQSGWLRELDDLISKTDACEVVLRFCKQLDQRESNATASHLRIVQDAVRDFALAINPDPSERIAWLQSRQLDIQNELDELNAGIVHELSIQEQRERIVEIYQLASVLTGDFRRVEDEIRSLDQSLRVQMIESGASRGAVLLELLQQEQLLANTDAGRAFEGFFHLLCDQNRNTEFREQLKSILTGQANEHLSESQSRFLNKLMRELTRESERVFQVRRRTEESLRVFIESGVHHEMRAVDRLLGKLERLAVNLKEAEVSPRTDTGLQLASGNSKIQSPDSIRLKMPEERIDTRDVKEQKNLRTPSAMMLEQLHSVKILQVAENMRHLLRKNQLPLSIAAMVTKQPVQAGLEELVACLRVARAVGATELPDTETVLVNDAKGHCLKAVIPHYLLCAELFPEQLEDLVL